MLIVQKILGAKSPRLLTSFFVGMSVFASSGAFAQIDEVIVRASKRETNLQSTPIAVSAIQAEDVNSLIARDIGDVAVLAPNFSAAKITGFNAAGFSMRGAGQTDIIVYSDPQVGVAIDDFIVRMFRHNFLMSLTLSRLKCCAVLRVHSLVKIQQRVWLHSELSVQI